MEETGKVSVLSDLLPLARVPSRSEDSAAAAGSAGVMGQNKWGKGLSPKKTAPDVNFVFLPHMAFII